MHRLFDSILNSLFRVLNKSFASCIVVMATRSVFFSAQKQVVCERNVLFSNFFKTKGKQVDLTRRTHTQIRVRHDWTPFSDGLFTLD